MSEETTPTTAEEITTPTVAEPWKDAGFDSFAAYDAHMQKQVETERTRHQNATKAISKQGSVLGHFRKVASELGVTVDEETGAFTKPGEPTAPTNKGTHAPVQQQDQVDYAAEANKLQDALTDEQKVALDTAWKEATPEQLKIIGANSKKDLVTDPKLRHGFIKAFVDTTGTAEPESFFPAPSPSAPAAGPDLNTRIRNAFFATANEAGRAAIPPATGGAASGGRDTSGAAGRDPQADYGKGRVDVSGGNLLDNLPKPGQ